MEPALTDRIIVARDLSPADAVMLRHRSMAAFVTSLGGPISHTAILARSLGIPAIVGLYGVIDTIRDQDELIVDAASGTVLVSPDERLLKQFELLQVRQYEGWNTPPAAWARKRCVLDDEETDVAVIINHRGPRRAGRQRCAGRSRPGRVYGNHRASGEEEQYQAYSQIIKAVNDS